jgi:hypothetical protein
MLRISQTLHGIPFLLLGNVLYLQYYVHCKKEKIFCTLAGYGLTYDELFPLQLEEYFYCHPQGFLHEIGRDPFSQQEGDFFPAYRIGMGKNSDMVGKIPPWKWDMVGKIPTWSETFRHGRKNSDMVRNKDREGFTRNAHSKLKALPTLGKICPPPMEQSKSALCHKMTKF